MRKTKFTYVAHAPKWSRSSLIVILFDGLSLLSADWMLGNDLHMVGDTFSGWLGIVFVPPPPGLHNSQHIRMWYLVIALYLIVVLKPFSRIHTRYSTPLALEAEKAHLYKML